MDQRNHGHSAELPGLSPPHTLAAAAQDLDNLIQQKLNNQHVSIIVGHSLGGKTTLEYLNKASKGEIKSPDQASKMSCFNRKFCMNVGCPMQAAAFDLTCMILLSTMDHTNGDLYLTMPSICFMGT